MKKKSFLYSDLSTKQLQHLKDLYVHKKVSMMSHEDLKNFVLEIISHQINDTIGKEEEMEAWREMSDFFGKEFEVVILDIQQKYKENTSDQISEEDPQKQRIALLEKNNYEIEKKDMWND